MYHVSVCAWEYTQIEEFGDKINITNMLVFRWLMRLFASCNDVQTWYEIMITIFISCSRLNTWVRRADELYLPLCARGGHGPIITIGPFYYMDK